MTMRGSAALFAGLGHETGRDAMVQAVLEGVAFAFADCRDALAAAGTRIEAADVIGGGSRSLLWIEILANVLGVPLQPARRGRDRRRLRRSAARPARRDGRRSRRGLPAAQRVRRIEPDPQLAGAYAEALASWRALYPAMATLERG